MSIVQIEVKTVKEDMQCDNCEAGYMRPTGERLLSNPPKYKHACNTCSYVETYNETYPNIKHIV